ncbi:MAG: tyrosine-type recombinase/integrase, partial [Rhodospirillales bacterium]|nr:tyrosine-type recombinase/integrase [Rhodospirillales bacterium]
MNKKLTKRDIDSFLYSGGWDVRWDSAISGFGVRLYPSGKKSYVLSYRNEKRQKRLMVLGQVNKITLDQARKIALKNLYTLANKVDPAEEKRKQKQSQNFEVIYNDYLERYMKPHNKSWQWSHNIFKRDILPLFGSKSVQNIEKQDVLKLLDKVVDRGSPTMANRVLAVLRKFMNWCVERGIIEISPIEKISKPAPEKSRDRVLTLDEIEWIWSACEQTGYPFGPYIQFLLLTAQRKGEVSMMRWADINFYEGIWVIPKENTKNGKEHCVPLAEQAVSLLQGIRALALGDAHYVFTTLGDRPFSGFSKAKARLDKLISDQQTTEEFTNKLKPWRIHDLRRTAASGMAELGISPHVVERVLNHSSGIISGVAAVYNRYDYRKEMFEALETWSTYLQKQIIL